MTMQSHAGKARPALRLIKTNDLAREEWLAVRKQGIGGSDAAAAIGLSPYKSQLELWLEKTGRDQNLPKVDPNDDSSPMYWGTLLEPIVAAHYTRRTGLKVRKVNAVLQHPDNDKPWMLANIDREVLGSAEVSILECKTAGLYGAKHWKEGVPEYVRLQVHHQLAVTGKQAADVAVLIAGQELQIHRIHRDETLIAQMVELERQFWAYVESDTPPPADGSESADMALRALYPSDTKGIADFREETEMNAVFTDLLAVRSQLGVLSEQESKLKQRIQEAMKEAGMAWFESGQVTFRRSKDSLTLNVSAALKAEPELRRPPGFQ